MNHPKRSTRIQLDEVAAAAEQLLREGLRPTVRGVRERIGGSPNHITPLLSDWFAQVGRKLAGPAAPQFTDSRPPASVWDIADSAVERAIDDYFAQRAARDANKRADAWLPRAEDCLRAARDAQADSARTIARLKARLEAAEAELARLRPRASSTHPGPCRHAGGSPIN